jgi:hypothetical protein
MIDLDTTPRRSDDFCVREVGDELIFLTEQGDKIISLNAMGAFIWEQIDGIHSLRDVLDIICDEYDVTQEQAEDDLRAFAAALVDHHLVSLHPADS